MTNTNILRDRQLEVSPGTTIATVTTGTDVNFLCSVNFRGHIRSAVSAGKNALIAGDVVSVAEVNGNLWVVKQAAGLPSRFSRPLNDWAGTRKADLALQYFVRNAKKDYTFRLGQAVSVVSTNVLRVSCADGVTRDLTVEYAGVAKAASSFSAGDPVLCFQKYPNTWVVVGMDIIPVFTVSPNSISFGMVNTLYSDTRTLSIFSNHADVTISASPPLSASPLTILQGVSGSTTVTFAPVVSGQFSGSINVTSGSDVRTIPITGIGTGLFSLNVWQTAYGWGGAGYHDHLSFRSWYAQVLSTLAGGGTFHSEFASIYWFRSFMDGWGISCRVDVTLEVYNDLGVLVGTFPAGSLTFGLYEYKYITVTVNNIYSGLDHSTFTFLATMTVTPL